MDFLEFPSLGSYFNIFEVPFFLLLQARALSYLADARWIRASLYLARVFYSILAVPFLFHIFPLFSLSLYNFFPVGVSEPEVSSHTAYFSHLNLTVDLFSVPYI